MSVATAILSELTEDDLQELARLLEPHLRARGGAHAQKVAAAWLNSTAAAEYLGCPRSRIHDLVQLGHLHPRRDGRRLLFKRDDLDAYLEASA